MATSLSLMQPELEIKRVDWASKQPALSALRRVVFIDEQAVPETLEWDNKDEVSAHFLAYIGSEAVGTTRLTPEGQIGRMAVLKPYRNQGIASALLTAVLDYATQLGLEQVFMHAQADVVPLYEKFGFIKRGEIFLEADIKHQQMYKLLSKNAE
jgi:predicted GNAT family N-acyltransferase